MNREKNGRFAKKNNIEINIPSIASLVKYSILLILFAPWLYLLIKFDAKKILENGLSNLFGPGECICPNQKPCICPETPY